MVLVKPSWTWDQRRTLGYPTCAPTMSRREINGRSVETVLRERHRVLVWFVEETEDGGLTRRPHWGTARSYDPNRGLQVKWIDDRETEWIDEGDDWRWETSEERECAFKAVQLRMRVGEGALCSRLPFVPSESSAPAAAPPVAPLEPTVHSVMGVTSDDSPRAVDSDRFSKKARLMQAFSQAMASAPTAASARPAWMPAAAPAAAAPIQSTAAAARAMTALAAAAAVAVGGQPSSVPRAEVPTPKRKHEDEETRQALRPTTQLLADAAAAIKKPARPSASHWNPICIL